MNIALLVGGIIYDSQKDLIYGVCDYAKERDVKVFVFTCAGDIYSENDHSKGEFQIYSLPNWRMFDGVIFVPNTIQNPDVVRRLQEELSALRIPVIVIDEIHDGLCSFLVDNVGALYDMTEHVISKHGKRKLLYLSGPVENAESIQRLKGFLECVEKYELQEERDYCVMFGDYWTDSGRSNTTIYLQRHGLPEAIICANDYMAVGAMETLSNAGYRIPQDVIVTGYDNSFEGRYQKSRLTTIQKPLYEMGKKACRLLIKGESRNKIFHFPVQSILTKSCGCNLAEEVSITEFKEQMLREKNNNFRWAGILNSMSADLNEIDTLEGFVEKLKFYVRLINFPYFYLCLCDDSSNRGGVQKKNGVYQLNDSRTTGYTDNIKVEIAYNNGVFYEAETIEKNNLLPEFFFREKKSVLSVVMPIHFRLHCMGYCVVGGCSIPMETIQFQLWVMNLGNSLENISNQMIKQDMIEQLNRMWIYDSMTGVLNRAGFYTKVHDVIARCKMQKKKLLLLFMDIDELKTVNDSYGHKEGDFYIKSVAEICQSYTGENGIVMRYGGDEFVLLCPLEVENIEEYYITPIKQKINAVQTKKKKPYKMDVSIGCYISELDDGLKLELLLEQADKDMYVMKKTKNGKEKKDGK